LAFGQSNSLWGTGVEGVSVIETNAANEWNGDEGRKKKGEWAEFRPIKGTPVSQHIVIKI
jgi:hypothetical protein